MLVGMSNQKKVNRLMAELLEPIASPVRYDATGAYRVGSSRVLLELVIRAFQDGATPEAIVQRYPTLALADVYSVVACYLKEPQPIDDYLAEREQLASEVKQRVQPSEADLAGIRLRIQAARKA